MLPRAVEVPPPVRYAVRDGASIAYQTFGSGRLECVVVSDPPSHLDLLWTDPGYVEVLLRLAGSLRLVLYDRRGMGPSDPLDRMPTLEEQALDLSAVMAAAGTERAALIGYGGSSAAAAYFAATRPDRVDRLALLHPYVQGWAVSREDWTAPEHPAERLATAVEHWGEGRSLRFIAPTLATRGNERLFAMLERASASRAAARAAWVSAGETDLTGVLPAVRAPTLVLRHAGTTMPPRATERVAELLPDATSRELDYAERPTAMGDYWLPILDEIELFLTGARTEEADRHRMLATLLFTDLVGSTQRAAQLGDAAWRRRLVRHHDLLRAAIDAEGGRLIKTVGDGSVSTFDGPVAAARCALRVREETAALGVEVRAGVHTGECERVGLDVAGLAVHVAARVEAAAGPGEVLMTDAARRLCRASGLRFAARGTHELKGVPGLWSLHAVRAAPEADVITVEPAQPRRVDRAVLLAARRAPRLVHRLRRVSRT